MIRNSIWKKTISVLLSTTISVSLVAGCANNKAELSTTSTNAAIDTEEIVERTTQAILDSIEDQPSKNEILEMSDDMLISADWKDYVGDMETFVYGLLTNELKYKYDVFPGYVIKNNGIPVYGIAYTDYSQCFSNDDGSRVVFESGFIPYCGETEISEDEFNEGLTLYDDEYQDDTNGFVFTYESDPFTEHCVVYGEYLKYGINNSGQAFYEYDDYDQEKVDESIGSLYSFDEEKYLYDIDFGEYIPISGTSLSEGIDYDELEKEINAILDEQDYNFSSVDIETYAYTAKEAIESYLLSMQQETFLGYDVDDLIELSQQLDPKECYRITSDGLLVIDIDETTDEAGTLVKWLVGTACVITTAVALVGSLVTIECPPLSAASSAIAGTAIEIFMQVVISGRPLDSIKWNRVALAAATGAVAGYLGPYIMAQYEGVTYFMVDSILDGILGGIERGTIAWLEGESGKEIIKQFGYGVALGFCLSAGFKGVGAAVSKAAAAATPAVSKIGEKIFPKLISKNSKLLKAFAESGAALYGLKEVADSSVFHSEYIANKMAWRQINRLLSEGDDELIKKSLDTLSNKNILDLSNKEISKDELIDIFKNASDEEALARIKIDDEFVDIIKKNGMIGIVFDKNKYQTVDVSRLLANRDENFRNAAKEYLKQWKKEPSQIPESVTEAIKKGGVDIEDMEPERLVRMIQESDMVMHENVDMQSITLVSRKLHDKARGGVAHMGGYGLAKYLKHHMGSEFFERFLTAASSAVVPAAT